MKNEKIVSAFYKYVSIGNAEEVNNFRDNLKESCEKIGIKGRILVSEEGMNGSICGLKERVEEFKKRILEDDRFNDMTFKDAPYIEEPFDKVKVIHKKEIISFREDVNIKNTGKHISPKEFLDIYGKDGKLREDCVLVDARNEYEHRVGKFKDALTLDIEKFSEFPEAIKKMEIPKEKKVVMYCTGGIRCEKASAFMKESGYGDVSQLKDGILRFGEEFPDTAWEGKCLVFDKRLIQGINDKEEAVGECVICYKNCDLYKDCKNPNCNEFISICKNCNDKMKGCCSQVCFSEYGEFCIRKGILNQGKRILSSN